MDKENVVCVYVTAYSLGNTREGGWLLCLSLQCLLHAGPMALGSSPVLQLTLGAASLPAMCIALVDLGG